MEGPLKGAALGAGLCRQAVPAEVAVPLAEFRVSEVGLAVVHGPVEPVQIFLLPGVPVEHKGGDQDFVVGPPELHIVLIGLRGLAQAVDEVEQAAVFLIPAGVDGPVEHLGGLGNQLLVAGALGVLQQEPDALDVVAGVDGAALGVVEPGGAVHVHVFQGTLELRLNMVLEDVVHTLLGPLLIEGPAVRVGAQHNAGDVEEDHRRAEGPAAACLRDGLRPHAHGVLHALAEVPVEVVALPCPLQPDRIAGDAVVLRVGDGAECLGEVVASLAQRLALGGDGKVHSVAAGAVKAVGLHEVQAAPAGLQPLRSLAVLAAQEGEHPTAASLHPHALVGGVDLPLPVQAGIHAAVDRIHTVFQPEVRRAGELLPRPRLGGGQFLSIHRVFLTFV